MGCRRNLGCIFTEETVHYSRQTIYRPPIRLLVVPYSTLRKRRDVANRVYNFPPVHIQVATTHSLVHMDFSISIFLSILALVFTLLACLDGHRYA